MRPVKRQAEHDGRALYNLCYRKNGTGSRSEMDIRERIVTWIYNRIFSDSRQVKQKN
jgi:hypothetical protein